MNRKIGLVFSYGVMITEIVSAMFVTPFIIRSLGQAGVRYLPAHFVNNRISDNIRPRRRQFRYQIYGEISSQ